MKASMHVRTTRRQSSGLLTGLLGFLLLLDSPPAGPLLSVEELTAVRPCPLCLPGTPLSSTFGAQAGEASVFILSIRGVINPPVASYVQRALREASERNAQLIVMQLDTPGGLDSSTRELNQAILSSPVPVAVYVAPSGARAASAGLFILMASHIAAMAPGTNTGAAHPVGLGGDDIDPVLAAKVENDAAATIRGLATSRGRNAEWAERAVRESVSVTAQEALDLKAIDLIARDTDELLSQLESRMVTTTAGTLTLRPGGAPRVEAPMTFIETFLQLLSDPNIAFILLSLGSLGLLAELYNPGALLPGITGVIALILAFFSLGNLPTNWAGVALLGFAVLLFVGELYTEGFGVLGIGAVVAFVLGGLLLFLPFTPAPPTLPDLRVDPWLLGGVTLGLGTFMVVLTTQAARARRAPPMTGFEHYAGQTAMVHQELAPRGRVWFEGQTWFAQTTSGQTVPKGQPVRIVRLEGLTLIVEPIAPANAAQK